jgi:hypothetical protein
LWSPFVLHTWLEHGLVMMCLVTVVVGQQRWPGFLPCGSAWRELGRSSHLADLLSGDLIVRPVSQACSTKAWSFTPPHGLARRGLGCTPRLVALLGEGLVVRLTSWICLAETWSYASPRRFAWRGIGRSSSLVRFLDRDLVVRPVVRTCSANGLERGLWAAPWVPRSWVPDNECLKID